MGHAEVVDVIDVPMSLIKATDVLPTAKLVWIALKIDDAMEPRIRLSPTRLSRSLGLARLTIRKAISTLISQGWYKIDSCNKLPKLWGNKVAIPVDLIFDKSLSINARLIHGVLQTVLKLKGKSKHFKYTELKAILHHDIKTVRKSVQQLTYKGWLILQQTNQLSPISCLFHNPIKALFESLFKKVKRFIAESASIGEGLMKGFLSLVINSDNYIDNASPGFLVNPATGRQLEFDRYYFDKVAFEFNGSQHYIESSLYGKDVVQKQMKRDETKKQLCIEKNIDLIVIHPHDLTLDAILQKIGSRLPLRNLKGADKVKRFLEVSSAGYRANTPDVIA